MTNVETLRSESAVFADLAELCVRPGYVHALAYLCFRDSFVQSDDDKLKEADLQKLYTPSSLIRTEVNTLMGLMVRADIDWTLPPPAAMQEYVDASDKLLSELHHSMSDALFADLMKKAMADATFNPFSVGAALREPIFYCGESAYDFQYRDLAARKYAADAVWLKANRGFTVQEASAVALSIERSQKKRIVHNSEQMIERHPDEWTMLPWFAVSVDEVASTAGLSQQLTERVLAAFALPEEDRNASFNALQDFNAVVATPLLRMPSGEFLCLQSYALAQALYDTPFYWMAQDQAYLPKLQEHRGDFTEGFVAERLRFVFGDERVYVNVNIQETKASRVGEIDVLAVWGDRAIVVQAKSKRLTLEARSGNDKSIRDDFKKSVQDSYDQAVDCAACLGDKRFTLVEANGRQVVLPFELKEIYVFCVVSDHYPALSFQAQQFLRIAATPRVKAPLIMDVFTVDAMTEMLQSPLQFLGYVSRRARYADQLMASHELTILAFHLKKNLWISSDIDGMHLADDFTAGLDIAMAVRRMGIPGAATPEGILTRFETTTLGRLVKEIEARPEPATIDLGFLLLEMNEDTVKDTSRAIDRLAARAKLDGKHHDLTLGFGAGENGLTVHCNTDPVPVALSRLQAYCGRRKYKEKAKQWFGLCMSPEGPRVRFGVSLSYAWVHNDVMEQATLGMASPMLPADGFEALHRGQARPKIGRNEPCPCGSGKKYKKCHLWK